MPSNGSWMRPRPTTSRNVRPRGGAICAPTAWRRPGRNCDCGGGASGTSPDAENMAMTCGSLFSRIVKSSRDRSVTGLPSRSRTRTSSGTSVIRLRNAGSSCFALCVCVWICGGGACWAWSAAASVIAHAATPPRTDTKRRVMGPGPPGRQGRHIVSWKANLAILRSCGSCDPSTRACGVISLRVAPSNVEGRSAASRSLQPPADPYRS